MNKIMHMGVLTSNGHVHYICNLACGVTVGKIAGIRFDVTCKNCLNIIKKLKNGKAVQEYINGWR